MQHVYLKEKDGLVYKQMEKSLLMKNHSLWANKMMLTEFWVSPTQFHVHLKKIKHFTQEQMQVQMKKWN